MSRNNKFVFMILTLFILLVGIASISAADVDDTQAGIDDTLAISDVTNEDTVATADNKVDKIVDKETDKLSTPQTINVDNSNFSSVFTTSGLSGVNDGDKIILTESVTSESSVIINKAINLTSANDAVLSLNTISGNYFGTNPGNSFSITSAGSFTNITSFHFYNTQVFVKGANNVTFDDVTVEVRNQQIGSGVGVTSIREGSSFITVKNSNFITENNGGSSSLVLADANYCSIENNEITGIGNVGNLLYLTTYNVDTIDLDDVETNSFNNITGNTITGPSSASICVCIVLTGHDNRVESNTINYAGTAIGTQWMGQVLSEEAVGDYDQRYIGNDYISNTVIGGGNVVCGLNSTITANTFSGNLNTGANSTVTSNQITGKLNLQANASASSNTVGGITSLYGNTVLDSNTLDSKVNVVGTNVIINDNTIFGDVNITKSDVLVNNSRIDGSITVKSGCTNVSVTNNQYTESITGATYEYNNTQVSSIENIGLTRLSKINNDKLSAGQTIYLTSDNYETYLNVYDDFITFVPRKCRGNTLIFDDDVLELIENIPFFSINMNVTFVQAANSIGSFAGLYRDEVPETGFDYTRNFINMTFKHEIKNKRSWTHFMDVLDSGTFNFQNCTFDIDVSYYPDAALENALIEAVNPNIENVPSIRIFNNCTFNIRVPGNTIPWTPEESTPRVIPFKLYGDEVYFTNNKVNLIQYKHDQEGAYPTDYGIMIGSNALVENNTFVITSETELGYLYAIDFISSSNCTVRNNNITVVGSKYTNGIYFTGSNYGNNTIENNFINLTSGLNAGTGTGGSGPDLNNNSAEDSGYGIVLEDRTYQGAIYRENRATVTDNRIINNTIYSTGYNVYGIESFGSNNTLIENNTIFASGNTPKAIGVISTNLVIKGNEIVVNGTALSGSTADYIPALTSGIIVERSLIAEITNNNIDVVTGPGIIAGIYNQTNIHDNYITTTNDYAITLNSSSNDTVVNNTLIAKKLRGNEAVDNSISSNENNIIENNLPAGIATVTTMNDVTGVVGRDVVISVKVDDADGNAMGEGSVTLVDVDNNVLGEATVDMGTADITVVFNNAYNDVITATYNAIDGYDSSTATAQATISKIGMTVTVEDVTASVGDDVEITANIVDDMGNAITGGRMSFKLNGNYIKDADGAYVYANVINGTAKATINAGKKLFGENTISAKFGGNSKFDAAVSEDATLTVTQQSTIVTVDAVEGNVNQTVTITAHVTDANGNTISGGRVSFKVNGAYVKDADGNAVKVDVVDGIATVDVTAISGWAKEGSTIVATYLGNNYYTRSVSEENTVSIAKDTVKLIVAPVNGVVGETVTFSAFLTNSQNKAINGGRIGFKVNGVTLKDANNTVVHVDVLSGAVSYTCTALARWATDNGTVEAIYGGNAYYAPIRATAKLVITEANN